MDKVINNNGYDYVDLGLPSGTLWATYNVGASKLSDYGLYFQWGDTKGYTKEQIGYDEGKKKFIYDDYKWYLSGSQYDGSIKFKKYTTTGATLDLEDDAAHVNMGGDWHMPTPNQFQELIDNTTNEFTTMDDVTGMLFTSKKDDSKFIFIPAAGYVWGGDICNIDDSFCSAGSGNVWTSMLSNKYVHNGMAFEFDPFYANLRLESRGGGLSVRGVIG